MELQKGRMIVCSMPAPGVPCQPDLFIKIPQKARSHILRCKRRLHFDDTSLMNKRRRFMFNENDMDEVEFKVTFNSAHIENHIEKKVILGSEKSRTAQIGNISKDDDMPILRKRKGKIVLEEKCINKFDVVTPQTPSPARGKAVSKRRGCMAKAHGNKSQDLSKMAANAYYYTRSINQSVINELIQEGARNQPGNDQHPNLSGQLEKRETMELQKGRMIVCSMPAPGVPCQPDLFIKIPQKARSHILRCKRRLHFDDTSLMNKRRRFMFNENDMDEVEFKVTFNSAHTENHIEKKVILGSEKSKIAQIGNIGKDDDMPILRKRKGEIALEEKCINKFDVVAPQTPSPARGKAVSKRRGSIAKPHGNKSQDLSEVAANAYYYTRSINKSVINELIQGQGARNQPGNDQHPNLSVQLKKKDDRRVSLKGHKKQGKKIKSGRVVKRKVINAWKVLLKKGVELYKGQGICAEVLFISKVGRIQGPRLHCPWKGSVLDSVIGALLTQRVNDKFSSSAFISLGTRFPQHFPCNMYGKHHRMLREKRISADRSLHKPACASVANVQSIPSNASKLRNPSRKPFGETKNGSSGKGKVPKKESPIPNWNNLRAEYSWDMAEERSINAIDSVDWNAVRRADLKDISEAISGRGMNKKLAIRIKIFLDRLVFHQGNLDLEWLRKVPTEKTKNFLLDIHGFGLKSAECVQLLSLKQCGFPVDVNVARVMVRLGWVPAPEIGDELQMYLLEQESKLHDLIHQCVWPRLSELVHTILYQLHYHMITFGKVFCTKNKPNCGECPMREECKHYNNVVSRQKSGSSSQGSGGFDAVHVESEKASSSLGEVRPGSSPKGQSMTCMPSLAELDIEDFGKTRRRLTNAEPALSIKIYQRRKCAVKDPTYIYPVNSVEAPKTPVKDQSLGRQSKIYKKNDGSPYSQTRTKHSVYELPDWHPILETFDDEDPEDKRPYLLIVWEPGTHDFQKSGKPLANNLLSPSTSCGKVSQTVPGTIMIPHKIALKGNFPLNGTYFQTNEVFADHKTSQTPIDVPRKQLKQLPRKTLYCGTDLSRIVKGLKSDEIHSLFNEGYICTMGFDRETSATRPLESRLHNRPKSRSKGQ